MITDPFVPLYHVVALSGPFSTAHQDLLLRQEWRLSSQGPGSDPNTFGNNKRLPGPLGAGVQLISP